MAYIGNQPFTTAFLTDQFSGNGSTTAFTLSAAPANTNSLLVAVTGVLQDPSTYSVTGTTLTFSAAPPSGTGNISVRFLGIPASGVTTTAYRTLTEFTATAGQTTFTPPSYTVGYLNVYRNGVLLGTADYTASNGTTVVLTNAASAGDLIATESFYVSSVLNAIPGTAGSVGTTYLTDLSVTPAKLSTGGPSWDTSGNATVTGGYVGGTGVFNLGSGQFYKDASGNTSLGTTVNNVYDAIAAARPLVVQSASSSTTVSGSTNSITICNSDTTTSNTSQINFAAITGANSFQFSSATICAIHGARVNGQYPAGQLVFCTSTATNNAPTEKVRIDSSGNLLVGTTTSRAVGFSLIPQTSLGAPYGVFNKSYSGAVSGIEFLHNGTTVGSITYSNTATSYNTSSDYRLKENVQPLTGALSRVTALKPCTYTWKADGSDGEGFIAHELAEVCPGAVSGEKDAVNEDGSIKPQGIDTSFLVATLTAAIQEQQTIIDELKARVAALENK